MAPQLPHTVTCHTASGQVIKAHELICWRYLEGRPCLPASERHWSSSVDVVIVPIFKSKATASPSHASLLAPPVLEPQPLKQHAPSSSSSISKRDAVHRPAQQQDVDPPCLVTAANTHTANQPIFSPPLACMSTSAGQSAATSVAAAPVAPELQHLPTALAVACQQLRVSLSALGMSVAIDAEPGVTPGAKYNKWEQRGVPLRVELGQREVQSDTACVSIHPYYVPQAVTVLPNSTSQAESSASAAGTSINGSVDTRAKKLVIPSVQLAVTCSLLLQNIHRLPSGSKADPYCDSADQHHRSLANYPVTTDREPPPHPTASQQLQSSAPLRFNPICTKLHLWPEQAAGSVCVPHLRYLLGVAKPCHCSTDHRSWAEVATEVEKQLQKCKQDSVTGWHNCVSQQAAESEEEGQRAQLFVGCIPFSAKTGAVVEMLQAAFQPFGCVKVSVSSTRSGRTHGWARVLLPSRQAATAALEQLHGRLVLDGSELSVSFPTGRADTLFPCLPYEARRRLRIDSVAAYSVADQATAHEVAQLIALITNACVQKQQEHNSPAHAMATHDRHPLCHQANMVAEQAPCETLHQFRQSGCEDTFTAAHICSSEQDGSNAGPGSPSVQEHSTSAQQSSASRQPSHTSTDQVGATASHQGAKQLLPLTVTDATACCGGSALALAGFVSHVHAVELDEDRAEDLLHNLRVAGCHVITGTGNFQITTHDHARHLGCEHTCNGIPTTEDGMDVDCVSLTTPAPAQSASADRQDVRGVVCVHQGDYTQLCWGLQQDAVFLDPPWGGPQYMQAASINDLALGDTSVARLTGMLLGAGSCRVAALRMPSKLDVDAFVTLVCDAVRSASDMGFQNATGSTGCGTGQSKQSAVQPNEESRIGSILVVQAQFGRSLVLVVIPLLHGNWQEQLSQYKILMKGWQLESSMPYKLLLRQL